MKEFTEAQVDALIRLKFGQLAYQMLSISYVIQDPFGSDVLDFPITASPATRSSPVPMLDSAGKVPGVRDGQLSGGGGPGATCTQGADDASAPTSTSIGSATTRSSC